MEDIFVFSESDVVPSGSSPPNEECTSDCDCDCPDGDCNDE